MGGCVPSTSACLGITDIDTSASVTTDGSGVAEVLLDIGTKTRVGTVKLAQAGYEAGLDSQVSPLTAFPITLSEDWDACMEDTGLPARHLPAPVRGSSIVSFGSAERVWSGSSVHQHHATAAYAPDGSRMVVWVEGDIPSAEMFFRVYAPDGSPRTDAVPFGPIVSSQVPRPEVSADATRFVIIYNTEYNVYLRAYDLLGVELTGGRRMNMFQGTDPNQGMPSLALHLDGSGALVWNLGSEIRRESSTLFRRFDVDLTPIGDETILDVSTGGAMPPDALALPDGQVAVAYTPGGPECDDSMSVRAQVMWEVLDPDGLTTLLERADRNNEAPWASRPNLAVNDDGDVALVWRRRFGGQPEGIWYRTFDPAGTPYTLPIQLDEFLDVGADHPDIEVCGDHAVVSWDEVHEDGLDIVAEIREVVGGGSVQGPIRVNETVAGDQLRPGLSVRCEPDGSMEGFITWQGDLGVDTVVSQRAFAFTP